MKPIIDVETATTEEVVEFVTDRLREATSRFIGQPASPSRILALQDAIRDLLKDMLREGFFNEDTGFDELVAVLMLDLSWAPRTQSRPNPRDLMEKVPTRTLQALMERMPGPVTGPLSFVVLEHQKRMGFIKDWSWAWNSEGTGGDFSIETRYPVQAISSFIKIDPTDLK